VDSAVPIDSFNSDQIEQVSYTDTIDILQTLVPSFNVSRQPISDGSSFIRPMELRGLPPHHTLVLINGKRRHRAALVGIGGDGEQGPDISTVPSVALYSVEVLRDGASSQYGSDAIAGVINFNLKTDSSGGTLVANTGSYFDGDGDATTIAGNIGLPLTENGFINLSAEWTDQEFSQRDHQYCEGWFCVDENNPRFADSDAIPQDYVTGTPTPTLSLYEQNLQTLYPAGVSAASVQGDVVQPWGNPNHDSVRVFVNAGIEFGNGMDLYGFGNYSESTGDGSFFYRWPGNGTIEVLRDADGTEYSPLEIFPGGFTPRFEGEVEDIGGVLGLRGATDGGFIWDVSGRFGESSIDYRLFNTINPSYGPATPTDFKPGELVNTEVQFQIDLVNEFDTGASSPLVLAYGVSYFDEEYDVVQSVQDTSYLGGPHAEADPYGFCVGNVPGTTPGEGHTPEQILSGAWTESIDGVAAVAGNTIADLDCAVVDADGDKTDPTFQVVGVGSNGFPGYSPAFSEVYSRDSYAVYADVSMDVTDSLYLQAAIRYEDYSDFGDETVGKIAGRLRLNDQIALRGSFGTGFRAPTPGQQGTTNVSTRLPNGFPVATGLFPASGEVSTALGATPLAAETSTSWTLGLTADIDELTLTIDFYSIEIDDRFRAISTLDVSTDCPGTDADEMAACANFEALRDAGVPGANSIGGVFYFQNAIDTKTTGIDVVASYPIAWDNGQDTTLQFAMNYNTTELIADPLGTLNAEDTFDLENRDPNVRWNLTANHSFNDSFSLMVRARYYGRWFDSDEFDSDDHDLDGNPLAVQRFSSVAYVDLEGSYQFNDNWSVSLGARNLFDEFPDKVDRSVNDNDYCCGRTYASTMLAPWQGGYYYGAVRVAF
jgi:iron complex outermembrane receptor protein